MYEYMRGLQRQFFKEPDFPELRQEINEIHQALTEGKAKQERRKLAHFAAPPFPTEPASLGFGGSPILSSAGRRKPAQIRPNRAGRCPVPDAPGKAPHSGSQGQTGRELRALSSSRFRGY